MNDKQQLAAMGDELRLTEEQAKGLSERLPKTGILQILDDEPLCMAKRIEELEAALAESRAEARKYKLSGLGMAASMSEHVCVPEGWRLIGYRNHSSPNGLRRFMTPKQYSKQTDGVKKWYEPVYAAPVPDGWQLVPVEPTQEMLDAAFTVQVNSSDTEATVMNRAYRAMLAAAPKPDAAK